MLRTIRTLLIVSLAIGGVLPVCSNAQNDQSPGAVFGMIAAGKLKLRIEHTYPLQEVQQAHRELESRKTTGKLLLLN